MPNNDGGYRPPGGSDGLDELHAPVRASRGAGPASGVGWPGQSDQVARDIAEIERAAAALRRAEPALETWSAADADPPPVTPKPRPVWLLIGLLWLSTALVTAGAVAAIARFAG